MRNAIKQFGIIALVAVIGFAMAACGEGAGGGDDEGNGSFYGNGGGGNNFVGSWYSAGNDYMRIDAASNKTWKIFNENNAEVGRGTYTVSGNSVILKVTYGFEDGQWKPYNSLSSSSKEEIPETIVGTISDDILILTVSNSNEKAFFTRGGGGYVDSAIVGTWVNSELPLPLQALFQNWTGTYIETYKLDADGKFTGTRKVTYPEDPQFNSENQVQGTYTAGGGKITLTTIEGGQTYKHKGTYKLSGNTLTITWDGSGSWYGGTSITYNRQ
jgi:hypothetical protein